jgi:cytochrome c551/c552
MMSLSIPTFRKLASIFQEPDFLDGGCSNYQQAAVVVASHNPTEIGPFYRHLADHVFEGDAEQAATASSEIRDVLMKSWTLIGIPAIITAMAALSKEDDKSFLGESVLSKKW